MVATNDEEKTEESWKDQISLNERPDEYRHAFEQMMPKYVSMWDGHFGRIFLTKHQIELTNCEIGPICCVPYSAGLGQGQLEKEEVNEMIKWAVVVPAVTE